jgi:hypothetical protein
LNKNLNYTKFVICSGFEKKGKGNDKKEKEKRKKEEEAVYFKNMMMGLAPRPNIKAKTQYERMRRNRKAPQWAAYRNLR